MKEKKPVDRRKYLRFKLRVKVKCHIKKMRKGKKPSLEISGITKNISVAGICFTSETKLEPGRKITLEMFLPFQSKPLYLEGEVKWSRSVKAKKDRKMSDTGVKLFTIDKGDEIGEDLNKSKKILEEQKGDLEKVNKELDDFTYIVSHDLKEPLRSIDAFSKFVYSDYKDKLDEEGKDYLERIRANTSRMQNLIEDLLEISRLKRGKTTVKEVEVEGLINEAKLRLEYTIKQKNAEIIIRNKLPKIFCDPLRLTEVFLNLISNAIKFTNKEKPLIEIGCNKKDVFDEFYVKDNGPGIEKEYWNKIFEIFQRLGKREEHEGTGIGLTIVKEIVEMHGGKIWVESKIGEGTTFYFTILRKRS